MSGNPSCSFNFDNLYKNQGFNVLETAFYLNSNPLTRCQCEGQGVPLGASSRR